MTTTADLELIHGYTLADLDRLTRTAVTRRHHAAPWDLDEQFAVARYAITETLYTATAAPTPADLIRTARDACAHAARQDKHHHGVDSHHNDGRDMAAYHRYWWYRTTPSPEDAVVDRLALAQIWPTLTPSHRQALAALTATGDYQAAADLLGVSYRLLSMRLSQGRAAFRELWHEGECPSRHWGRDCRRRAAPTQLESVAALLRHRSRTRVRRAALAAGLAHLDSHTETR